MPYLPLLLLYSLEFGYMSDSDAVLFKSLLELLRLKIESYNEPFYLLSFFALLSSSAISFFCSFRRARVISSRQTGHAFYFMIHCEMHSRWKKCDLHGSTTISGSFGSDSPFSSSATHELAAAEP